MIRKLAGGRKADSCEEARTFDKETKMSKKGAVYSGGALGLGSNACK